MGVSLFLIFAALVVRLCQCTVYTSFSKLERTDYDFVIVGGGAAGLVVANRLTENPDWSILVIEAGGSHDDDITVQVPFLSGDLSPKTPYDWNFTTTPQKHLNGRTMNFPRGFLLGGCTSINHMAYSRGSFEDFDSFAEIVGDEGWSWDNLVPYFLKSEKLTPPVDNHDVTGQVIERLHGHHGPVGDSLSGWPTPLDSRVLRVTQDWSDEFPYREDTGDGNALGISWALRTVSDGTRSSASVAYLADEYRTRPNLDVLINTRVTRLLQTQKSTDRNIALRTVEIATSARSARHNITASKEVILSAGAVGSPHILLHSGIGDSRALKSLGINTVLNNPSVGRNLSDHPVVRLTYRVNETDTFEALSRNKTLLNQKIQEWQRTKTGVLTNIIGTQWGWFRLPDNSTIWEGEEDPASGPNTAHFELIFLNGMIDTPPPTGNYMTIVVSLVSPNSRGSLTLNSTNPFDAPLIDPNFFSSALDLKVMRESIKVAQRFAKAQAWRDYIIEPFNTNATSNRDLEALTRELGTTAQHASSTLAMSARDAPYGVVDPDLKVKKVSGLRVVDASVFPKVPTAHIQVPVYAFAERASDLIKETWTS